MVFLKCLTIYIMIIFKTLCHLRTMTIVGTKTNPPTKKVVSFKRKRALNQFKSGPNFDNQEQQKYPEISISLKTSSKKWPMMYAG